MFVVTGIVTQSTLPMQDRATPLHVAALKGNAGILKMLLQHGADLQAADKVMVIFLFLIDQANCCMFLVFSPFTGMIILIH